MASRAKRGSAATAGAGANEPEAESALDVAALLERDKARQAQAALEAARAAYDALAVEHARLQEARRLEEREGFEVASLLRQELAAKAQALAALEARLGAGADRVAEVESEAVAREAAAAAAHAAERVALQQAADTLQARLDGLAQFQAQKDNLVAEMQWLRQENARIAQESGGKVRALQRRLHELEHADEGGAPGSGGEEEACTEAEVHRLLEHSRRGAAEMQQYLQEAEELQREMKALETERAALLRDVQLKEELEQQYAKRGTLQARKISSAQSKISSLEKGLVRMAADFEQEKAALEQELRAQLADAVAEQNSLRRLLQVRTKELRTVRKAAQEVLLQRSEVEAFLVSSIQQARAEMAAEASAPASEAVAAAGSASAPIQEQQDSSGTGEASRSPSRAAVRTHSSPGGCTDGGAVVEEPGSRTAAVHSSASTAGGSGPVDVRDLSWQDRERILRLLFAKINRSVSVQPPVASLARTQALSEVQAETPLPQLRGLATEAGPAGLA